MSIKNILVSYNGSDAAKSALKTALILAERYNAHLTGVLAHGLPNVLYSYGAHVSQSAIDQLEEADKAHRTEVQKEFMAMVADHRSDHIHFLDVYGDADEMLMDIALGYDLVVMGAASKRSEFPHMEVHPDVVARNSGKPVLVVPRRYDPADFNDRILLAWDGKRAASRAMSDALNLLKPDTPVSVLCVGSQERAEAKALPVLSHLDRHGYAPKLTIKTGKKIAKIVLATIAEANAGMLVMGAYEHAKLAEDLFGGVTNTVLKKASVPVLLSH